jgi:hypothetical protein
MKNTLKLDRFSSNNLFGLKRVKILANTRIRIIIISNKNPLLDPDKIMLMKNNISIKTADIIFNFEFGFLRIYKILMMPKKTGRRAKL